MTSTLHSFMQLLGTLVIFAAVIFLIFLTTKWMGGFQRARSNNRNLRLIESIGVGNNKFIAIVEAAGKYLVVSVGKDEIHLLCELDADALSISEEEVSKPAGTSFSEMLAQMRKSLPGRKSDKE